MKRALAAVAVVLAACTAPADSDEARSDATEASPTAPATTQAEITPGQEAPGETAVPQTSSSLPQLDLPEAIACADAEEDFAVFCEAVEVINDRYVDEIPASVLAAAALRGLEEFDASGSAAGPIACATPSDEFGAFCMAATAQTMTAAPGDVVDRALRGIIEFGLEDPNSAFLDTEAVVRVREDQSGQVEGIGALVRTEDPAAPGESAACTVLSSECQMVIVSVLEGSPALAAGVEPGDITVSVNGELVEGWTLDEVVAEVRGPAGTDVQLGFDRDGELVEVTITRASLTVPVVEHELLADNVGYLRLHLFSNNSASQVRDALEDLLDLGASSIVLDLQDNPGGALNAAVDIASEFVEGGLVLRTEGRDESIDYDVQRGGIATDPSLEVVILMNQGSASASEVVSGMLQERGRAMIVGTNSFGKNTVQQQFSLTGGNAIKVTTARWLTPLGNDFGKVGITPDVFIEPVNGSSALDAALELLST